ncbi:MAG TPA: hypothetical protein DD490_17175 [Acidobacteria bacterium]|nr:hypothetical protein [Acidobacteriota bacterium]
MRTALLLAALLVTGPVSGAVDRAGQIEDHLRTAEGRARYELLVELAVLHFDQGEESKILAPAEEAFALLPAFPDPGRELALLKALLQGYAQRRDLDRALEIGRRAEALAGRVGASKDRAWVARRLGDVYRYRGAYEPALAHYATARTLYEQLGDAEKLGGLLSNVCVTYQALARYTEALDACQRALEAYERAGNASGVALALANLGVYYETLGLYEEALASLEDAVRRAEGADNPEILAKNLRILGEFLIHRDVPGRALPHLRRALELFLKIGQRGHLAATHLLLGEALDELGEADAALAEYESALALATELETPIDQAQAWQKIAGIEATRGRTADAVDLLERAVAVFRAHGNERLLVAALADLATGSATLGRHREAFAALQEQETLQEKVLDAETRRTMAEMQVRFEAKEKERRIELLTKDRAIQAAELRRQEQLRGWLVAAFLAVVTILVLLFNRYRLGMRAARLRETIELERQATARLREVDRMKDQFLANVSHELRTPLFGIIGLAESMLGGAKGPLPPTAREHLGTIVRSGQRLQRLVSDALDTPQSPPPAEPRQEPRPEPPEAVKETSAPARILVVDDEPVNRLILGHQLAVAGYTVKEAVDGFQALESLDGVDLVLLDVMMPRMSGYEVCRTLRERFSPRELPVIFVTAKSRPEDREEGFAAGGNDFLTKPVAMEELLARVADQLTPGGDAP